MAVKVTKPQVDLREEINQALTLSGLENQSITVNGLESKGKVQIGRNPRGYTGGHLFVHNDAGLDSTTKAELSDNAVLLLQPHSSNSTHMAIGQVNGGNGMGIQVTNAGRTAEWDIALNPYGGAVGIGTDAPGEVLEVRDGTVLLASTTTSPSLQIQRNDGSGNVAQAGFNVFGSSTNIQPRLAIGVGAAGFAPNASVFIGEDGMVGLGLSNPTVKLYVYEDDSTFANTELRVHNNKADDAAVLRLRGERTTTTNDVGQLIFDNSNKVICNIRGATGQSTTAGQLEFWTAASSANATKKLTITENGSIDGTMIYASTVEYSGNVDDLKRTGFYRSEDVNTNNPTGHYYSIVVFGNQGNVTAQIAVRLQSTETYVRSFNNSWTSWARLDT